MNKILTNTDLEIIDMELRFASEDCKRESYKALLDEIRMKIHEMIEGDDK